MKPTEIEQMDIVERLLEPTKCSAARCENLMDAAHEAIVRTLDPEKQKEQNEKE